MTGASATGVSIRDVVNPPGHYGLCNKNSNKCLAVLASGAYGSRATQTTWGNFQDQSWHLNDSGALTEIRNDYSGQCLTAQGYDDDAPVYQYTCTGLDDQKWYAHRLSANSTWWVNYHSKKCLLVQGTEEGNPAKQTTCGYFQDQYWDI
ncbi:RICIN domain-containing protein [Kitasatospora sp. NPDC059827]|uniref:RICIN domain-containing protein n=1 Tax=Kitasatospora sp. NPDC059827 TaxID=3346964 RepID=UPI00364FE05C